MVTRRVLAPVLASLALAAAPTPEPQGGAAGIADRQAGATRAGEHETPPVLAASKLLAPGLLRGPHHRVAEEVRNDGYMNHFVIESDFGRLEAEGRTLLGVRIREIGATAELDEVSKTKVFLESAAKAAVKPVETAAKLVKDPAGTVKGVPGGAKRAFGRLKRTAGKAADEVKGDDDDEEAEDGKPASEKAAALARSYLGITGAHRKWAEKLGVDPYTTNKPLAGKLDAVAKVDRAGGIAAGFAVPSLPGAASAVLKVGDLVWSKDPYELYELNRARLDGLGIEEALRDRFLANRFYTPSKQTAVVAGLHALGKGAHAREFLVPAVLARSEEEALFYAEASTLLAGYAEKVEPVTRLLAGRALAPARTGSGKVVHLVAVDHLCWTPELEALCDGLTADPGAKRELWVTGVVTRMTREELGRRGFTVREDARAALDPALARGEK